MRQQHLLAPHYVRVNTVGRTIWYCRLPCSHTAWLKPAAQLQLPSKTVKVMSEGHACLHACCMLCVQMVRPTNEMDRVHDILRLDDHPELEVRAWSVRGAGAV